MQSITAVGFLLALCVASSFAACQLEVGGTAESYVCEAINNLEGLSTVPATAQRITIFNSKLTSLPENGFLRFGATLAYLNITHCELSEIRPGAFAGLRGLRDLVLDYNLITSIKDDWARDLVNLKTLRVWHNHITEIEPAVFEHLSNLELLDIAYNKIDHCLPTEHLEKLKNLEYLYITGNPWPLRCRPPVFFHLENHHVQLVHNWGISHILIAECIAHELHAQFNDDVLQRCVERLAAEHKIPITPVTPAVPHPHPRPLPAAVPGSRL